MNIAIFVSYPLSKQQESAAEKDLFWYNYDTQEMETYRGSDLSMSYEYDENKKEWITVPKAITTKYYKDIKLKNKVMEWFAQYQNYNETEAQVSYSTGTGIIFDVPENEEDDFTDALKRNRFIYEIR